MRGRPHLLSGKKVSISSQDRYEYVQVYLDWVQPYVSGHIQRISISQASLSIATNSIMATAASNAPTKEDSMEGGDVTDGMAFKGSCFCEAIKYEVKGPYTLQYRTFLPTRAGLS